MVFDTILYGQVEGEARENKNNNNKYSDTIINILFVCFRSWHFLTFDKVYL